MIENGMILDGLYQIIQEIGRGGTGIIYLAEHLRLHKKVVVKKVKDHFAGQINGRGEADILKGLHHSYLPQVYDFLMIGSSIYTVMDYIEGKDLQYYLERKYTFPEELVRKWLSELAEVLCYLHNQQPPILHSDIKPGNIMITPSGDVCLIDFNISLDGENSKDIQGVSPWYAAPEQYERAQNILFGKQDHIVLDGRMDIYSLGATFYRVMTGRMPMSTEDQSRMMLDADIPYSDGLKAIVSRMIRPIPSKRYAAADKVQAALADISKADPTYRRCGYFQAGILLGWVICVITGVLCIYYGSWKNTEEIWQQGYQDLYAAVQNENETEIIIEGTELLNRVRPYLKKNKEKKAEVLNILGDSYFRQGQYKEAVSYYQEAWELETVKSRYCENYVVALIRAGLSEQAENVVSSAEAMRVLSKETRELIALEIVWTTGKPEKAKAELEKLAASYTQAADSALIENAYLLLADIYKKQGDYAEAIEILEDALQMGEKRNFRRALGELYFLAAQEQNREVYRNSYLSKALGHYEKLQQSGNPSYEDGLNLALVERALGKYEQSNAVLQELLLLYPDQYVLPMWMCYNYLDIVQKDGNYQKIQSDLNFRYQSCKYLYDSQGTKDDNMEKLKEILSKLGE